MLPEIKAAVDALGRQLEDLAGRLDAGGKKLPAVEAAKLLVLLDGTRGKLAKASAAIAGGNGKGRKRPPDEGPGLFDADPADLSAGGRAGRQDGGAPPRRK